MQRLQGLAAIGADHQLVSPVGERSFQQQSIGRLVFGDQDSHAMLPASSLGLARVGVAVFALAYEDGGWHEHTVADHKQNRRRCERQKSVDRRNAQQNVPGGDDEQADAEKDPVLACEGQFGASQICVPSSGVGALPGR